MDSLQGTSSHACRWTVSLGLSHVLVYVYFIVKHYKEETGLFIVRVLQSCSSMLIAGTATMTEVGSCPAAITSCATSGRESLCVAKLEKVHRSTLTAIQAHSDSSRSSDTPDGPKAKRARKSKTKSVIKL